MDIEVESTEQYGIDSYKALFEEIMSDIGKAALIDKAKLVLDPHRPLFIFSIRLKAEPASKKIGDVANIRSEGDNVHITTTDERYAPDILSQLWKVYGRGAVIQQTRFDMDVKGAKGDAVSSMIIASGEESMKEIVGSLWRTMPEGIKNRHTYIDGPVVTVVATEEILQKDMLEDGLKVHKEMRGVV
jgi:putative methanogenesis marker protein 17